ncbi:MAG: MFS transporter [Erysipelotrichaceae bacterium]|nr:MFS transporter [Erysipelotrichaceae bacterium]
MDKKEREKRELERLEKASVFHGHEHYFAILIIVLSIVYIVDELASNVRGIVEVQTVRDLFNVVYPSTDYDKASATLGFVTMAGYLSYLISPFYKSLADKYGRRLFLIINTIGMGVGMLICIISKSIALYIVGVVIMTFFTPNDMQVIYIMECAPKQHRAKLCSITKGIALISVSSLGLFVKLFVNDAVPATWRNVFIIPIILAFVIGIAAIYLVRETPVYTQKRLEYLRASEEERQAAAEAEKKQEENEKKKSVSVWSAFSFIFTNPQTRAIAIVALLMAFSTGYTGKYQPMLEAGRYNGVMNTDAVNIILMFYPLINGVFTMIGGFITDSLGRKKSALILGLWASLGLAVFAYGCIRPLNPYIIGLAYGISIAGLWSISDMIYFVITSESTPTEMRASVVGSMQLIGMFGTGFNMIYNNVVTMLAGSTNLPVVLTVAYLPLMAISLLIMMLKVKETKGVDLDNVKVDE